jgi:hypothetical protein
MVMESAWSWVMMAVGLFLILSGQACLSFSLVIPECRSGCAFHPPLIVKVTICVLIKPHKSQKLIYKIYIFAQFSKLKLVQIYCCVKHFNGSAIFTRSK